MCRSCGKGEWLRAFLCPSPVKAKRTLLHKIIESSKRQGSDDRHVTFQATLMMLPAFCVLSQRGLYPLPLLSPMRLLVAAEPDTECNSWQIVRTA